MSDFTSSFWSLYVTVLTVLSIVGCGWLLVSLSKAKVVAGKTVVPTPGQTTKETTGHVWDGDLAELNNPLPKWWMNLFWITLVFGVGYIVYYPGLGSMVGMGDWSQVRQYDDEMKAADAKLKPLYDKFAAMSIPDIAANPEGRQMGQRIFLNNCAPCHGSDARGARGFPNLTDNDWLYGGSPEAIETSIANGRNGVMPSMLAAVGGEEGVRNVVAYVRSLSGLPHNDAAAAAGKEKFTTICAACHGPDGKGNQAIGAPNLTDNIWIYGSSEAVMIETVTKGRGTNTLSPGQSVMPAWKETLGPAKVHLVAAYVWSLSNKAAK